jgi:hypothetical protein
MGPQHGQEESNPRHGASIGPVETDVTWWHHRAMQAGSDLSGGLGRRGDIVVSPFIVKRTVRLRLDSSNEIPTLGRRKERVNMANLREVSAEYF